MDELISKQALLKMMSHWKPYMDMGLVRQAVKKFPVVDAVPVVRCKDCKWLYDEMDDYCCRSHRGLVRICENSYCSHGERKENETN